MERTFATPINNKDELKRQGINFKQLAENAIEIFFIQVFEHNFFHADMHPGNIFIQKNGDNVQFVLVDFGIMGSLSKFDKKYLAENFVAFFNRDYEKVARLHVECEWVPRNTNILLLEKAIRISPRILDCMFSSASPQSVPENGSCKTFSLAL